jgi:chromosome segregation ATPase
MDPRLIDTIIAGLTEFKTFLGELGPIDTAHQKAKEDLEATQAHLEATKAELSNTKSGLTLAQLKVQRDHEEAMFNKTQQLKSLDAKIADAQSRLGTLNVEVSAKAEQHKQIEDSLNNLKKHHFG